MKRMVDEWFHGTAAAAFHTEIFCFCFREMFWRRMERNVNLLPLHYTALSTMQIVRGLVPRIWCSSPWKNIMRSIQIDITLDAQLTCYVVIESPLNCVYFILKRLQNSNSKQKDSRKSPIYNLYINLYKHVEGGIILPFHSPYIHTIMTKAVASTTMHYWTWPIAHSFKIYQQDHATWKCYSIFVRFYIWYIILEILCIYAQNFKSDPGEIS